MLSWPALPRRFFGIGGGPSAGSRASSIGGGPSSSSVPCGARTADPRASSLVLPLDAGFAAMPPPAPDGTLAKCRPRSPDFGADAGRDPAVPRAGRFRPDLAAGRADRFAFGRDFERDAARALLLPFGRARDFTFFPEEARFFIFLGLLDLDLLLERFPAMNDSYVRRRTAPAFRGGIVIGAWASFKLAGVRGTRGPAGRSVLRASVREDGFVHRRRQQHVLEG